MILILVEGHLFWPTSNLNRWALPLFVGFSLGQRQRFQANSFIASKHWIGRDPHLTWLTSLFELCSWALFVASFFPNKSQVSGRGEKSRKLEKGFLTPTPHIPTMQPLYLDSKHTWWVGLRPPKTTLLPFPDLESGFQVVTRFGCSLWCWMSPRPWWWFKMGCSCQGRSLTKTT